MSGQSNCEHERGCPNDGKSNRWLLAGGIVAFLLPSIVGLSLLIAWGLGWITDSRWLLPLFSLPLLYRRLFLQWVIIPANKRASERDDSDAPTCPSTE